MIQEEIQNLITEIKQGTEFEISKQILELVYEDLKKQEKKYIEARSSNEYSLNWKAEMMNFKVENSIYLEDWMKEQENKQ